MLATGVLDRGPASGRAFPIRERKLADKIIEAQRKEIGEMEALVKELEGKQ